MATAILMRNPHTGLTKTGFYGFSWTTFFSGGVNAFFRGEPLLGVIYIFCNFILPFAVSIMGGFMYNRAYTLRLIEKGYKFAGSPEANAEAARKLRVAVVEA